MVEHTVAPSCIASFPIVIVGLFGRRVICDRITLLQVSRGAEASAVRSKRWYSAKKTESGGEAMARGH